ESLQEIESCPLGFENADYSAGDGGYYISGLNLSSISDKYINLE
ncbi:unnamed protein product, partial [marine sediment metagenome]